MLLDYAAQLYAAQLLGKKVRVKIDERVVVEGKLLQFDDGGEFSIRDEMGFVHQCWPMLQVEPLTIMRGTE